VDRKVGEGGFGVVFQATHFLTNCSYAIKHIRIPSTVTASDADTVFKEAQSLLKLKHTGIVKLYNAFKLNNTIVLMLEFLEGGDLDAYMKAREDPWKEDEIRLVLS